MKILKRAKSFILRHDRLAKFALGVHQMLGIKRFIVTHDSTYVLAQCISHKKDPKYIRLIRGYYDNPLDYTTFLVEHKGEKHPDKIIYVISFGEPDEDDPYNSQKRYGGLCALLRRSLSGMKFPDMTGMTPTVLWGTASWYHDTGMDPITKNVFEYYFEPISCIPHEEIKECRNVIEPNFATNRYFAIEKVDDVLGHYRIDQEEIEKLSYLYKKYVHLNQKTREYLEEQVGKIINRNGGILGVHVRGTDFSLGTKDHPVMILPEEYIEKVKEIYSTGAYHKIFIATDDANVLKLFKEEFQEELLYYEDVMRSENYMGAYTILSDRPLHQYKLGLEVLRDVYTLASCDALVCGMSQVAIAARYISHSMGRSFKDLVILDQGIHEKSSEAMRLYSNELSRRDTRLKRK